MKGRTLEKLQYAVIGIGSLAFLPIVVTTIGGINNARRERRRQAMLARHAERLWR
jgi:hypothetical protein